MKKTQQSTINVQFLYHETHKTLRGHINEDLNKWGDVTFSWKGRLSIVKMSVLLKLIYKFSGIPIKIKRDVQKGMHQNGKRGSF